MRQHTNAFDLIRLAAAGMVLWSHQHALMGLAESGMQMFRASWGGIGVLIFFAISGYLNTQSIIRRGAMTPFLLNRGLRIYPALAVCIGFTVLVGACAAPDLKKYLDYDLLLFVGKDATLFAGFRAGVAHPVFAGNAFQNALNGSLWTLTYEVRMYVALALCFVAFRFSALMVLFACAAGMLAIGFSSLGTFWLQYSAMFVAGCFVAVLNNLTNRVTAVCSILLVSALFYAMGQELFALYLLLAATVIAIGCITLPSWLRPPLDLSYAVYLYAWPVQQVSAMVTKNFWIGGLFATGATLALAFLSVTLIEQPALRLKPAVERWTERCLGIRRGRQDPLLGDAKEVT